MNNNRIQIQQDTFEKSDINSFSGKKETRNCRNKQFWRKEKNENCGNKQSFKNKREYKLKK